MFPIQKCDALWASLSEYVDGRVTPEVAAVIEQHIADCHGCAEDLQFMRATTVALVSTPEVQPPAYLRQAILDATVNKPTAMDQFLNAMRRWFPVRQTVGLLAGGVVATILFASLTNGNKINFDNAVRHGNTNIQVAQINPSVQSPSNVDPSVSPAIERQPVENLGPPMMAGTSSKYEIVPVSVKAVRNIGKNADIAMTVPPVGSTNLKNMIGHSLVTKKLLPRSGIATTAPIDDMPMELMDMPTVPAAEAKPIMKMNMMDMVIVKNGMEDKPNKASTGAETKVAPAVQSGTGRIILVSSITSSGGDNVTNLAALRNSLRQKNDSSKAGISELSMFEKNKLLDVYRQRF